ncbi:hypothetical protein GX441_07940 [bacterium]|nr:hypothetical protein [bacterium]
MKFINWLSRIDRRVIFILVTLVVLIPLLLRIPIPFEVGKQVRDAYDAIEKLPAGSVLMLSVDYDATSSPECQPMLDAMTAHAFRKDLKILLVGHIVQGLPLGQMGIERIAAEYNDRNVKEYEKTGNPHFHKEYGKDYLYLSYNPGYTAVMVGLGREIRDFYPSDYKGVSVDSFPIMKNVHNYNDIALLVSYAHGPIVDAWVEFAGGRFGQKIIAGVTGVNAPGLYTYIQSGQLVGLVGGLKGASEYESLLGKPGAASGGMPAQSTAHILIIVLILIGSAADFAVDIFQRRKK